MTADQKPWCPQAIQPDSLRSPVHVFHDRRFWEQHIRGVIPTVDATGVRSMAWEVCVGDLIGYSPVEGGHGQRVLEITFEPWDNDVPGWHRVGVFRFRTDKGHMSVTIDGNRTNGVGAAIYRYPEKP